MRNLAAQGQPAAGALEAALRGLCRDAGRLEEATSYVLSLPGKRLRARILLGWVESDEPQLLEAAAAVELLHEGSLCHDDVCDLGLTRRGRPSVAARFGVRCAGLTGAFFIGRGIEALGRICAARWLDPGLECLEALALGQILEVASPEPRTLRDRYRDVVEKKTGTLFRYPAELGARWRGEDPSAARSFGDSFALAFQALDDLADLDARDALSWPVVDWIEASEDPAAAFARWSRGEVGPGELLAAGAADRTREWATFQLARARSFVEDRPAILELFQLLHQAGFTGRMQNQEPYRLPPASSRTSPAVRAYEEAIAAEHPDSAVAGELLSAAALIDAATHLLRELPADPLAALPPGASLSSTVMMGDHFLAAAARTLAPLGASALAHLGEMIAGAALAEAEGPGDPAGVTRLLAQIVAEARGEPLEPWVAARVDTASRLAAASAA